MRVLLALCLLLSSCGYRFGGEEAPAEVRTISVPYVRGDGQGWLTSELVRQLSDSGYFQCVQSGGELVLNSVLISDTDERIGYRYDRHGPQAKRRHRLIDVEKRRTLVVEISVIHGRTDEILLEPTKVSVDVDYDYIDPYSLRDLVFIDTAGTQERTLNFSLGQLDSFEGAQDGSSPLLYRLLAKKIVDGLIHQKL